MHLFNINFLSYTRVVMSTFFFHFFTFVILVCSLFVITVINPVFSVMFLVLVFIGVSGIFFVLQVEFIALIFLIVYVGAIAILFLFVVMMLDIKVTSKTNDFFKYLPIGGVVGGIFLFKVLYILFSDFAVPVLQDSGSFVFSWEAFFDQITNIELIGRVLYTAYFLYFLISYNTTFSF